MGDLRTGRGSEARRAADSRVERLRWRPRGVLVELVDATLELAQREEASLLRGYFGEGGFQGDRRHHCALPADLAPE